jgi:hypothetical protein
MTNAWTIGTREAYDKAVRIPNNAKAPGGIVFARREQAEVFIATHLEETEEMAPYEVVLPGPWLDVTTTSRMDGQRAYHEWHTTGLDAVNFDLRCGVCRGDLHEKTLDHAVLLVEAPFVMPEP